MKSTASSIRRWLIRVGKLAIVALVAWGVQHTASSALRDLQSRHWSPADLHLAWLALAGVVYLAGMLPSAWFWYRILQGLGGKPRLFDAIRAFYVGHLGKYVPGKAVVVLLRASMVRGEHVPLSLGVASVFYETFLLMSVGAFLAACVLCVGATRQWEVAVLSLLASIGLSLPCWPGVMRVVSAWVGVERLRRWNISGLSGLPLPLMIKGFGWMVMTWLFQGLCLWCTLMAVGYTAKVSFWAGWIATVGASAASLVVGFLSFVPGGLVVREALLLLLLEPVFGQAPALVSAIVLRLVTVVAEVLISGILYPLGGKPRLAARLSDERANETCAAANEPRHGSALDGSGMEPPQPGS